MSAELDPDVCEAAALIHDLGHPPFGHNGETTLDRLARNEDDTTRFPDDRVDDGYEGNAQSLRIVTKLAVRSTAAVGLNLTAATLRASVKYPCFRGEGTKGKFGVYRTETDEFDKTFAGLPQGRQTFEAEIMDWSDDIAYSVHDFYDFALGGVIPLERIKDISSKELKSLLRKNRNLDKISLTDFESVISALKPLPLPNLGTASRFSSHIVADLKAWVSALITRYASQELSVKKRGKDWVLSISTPIRNEVEILKALTYHYAIGSPALALRQTGEKTILRSLFAILLEDAKTEGRLLSDEAKERLDQEGIAVRIVLDTISGMTDAQAMSMHHKATGVVLASVLDVTTPSVM